MVLVRLCQCKVGHLDKFAVTVKFCSKAVNVRTRFQYEIESRRNSVMITKTLVLTYCLGTSPCNRSSVGQLKVSGWLRGSSAVTQRAPTCSTC
jgi:hypothetical protein